MHLVNKQPKTNPPFVLNVDLKLPNFDLGTLFWIISAYVSNLNFPHNYPYTIEVVLDEEGNEFIRTQIKLE